VDGDGLSDTQYFSEYPVFQYGISTASGATFSEASGLAGPAKHSGWSARMENDVVLTVIDDGRSARVLAFVDCAFVIPVSDAGEPLRLSLGGRGAGFTGLACFTDTGGRWLYGMVATRQDSGLTTITRAEVGVNASGTNLRIEPAETVAVDVADDDPQARAAMLSSCEAVPKVATSGR
jgi:hypothetical protein